MTKQLTVYAPAKINLFLHIVGQRHDGYHLLQSVFQLIDLHDEITLSITSNQGIARVHGSPDIPPTQDLVVRAAQLLQHHTGTTQGCSIEVNKHIPMGAGLGGGSSDAAATLWGLNELWKTGLPRHELMQLGLELGADVPFFLLGTNAYVQGVGEDLQAIDIAQAHYLLIYPNIHISTADVFKSSNLTRNRAPITITDFIESADFHEFGTNDCESVVVQQHQEVAKALNWLKSKAPASRPKMSGSGSTVFAAMNKELAQELLLKLPTEWKGFVVKGLQKHPSYNPVSDE